MASKSIFYVEDDSKYEQWVKEFDVIQNKEIEFLEQKLRDLTVLPLITIVPVAVGPVSRRELSALKNSLDAQVYPNWRIYSSNSCDVSDLSVLQCDAGLPPDFVAEMTRAPGFILPLPCDAILRPNALATFILALTEVPDADILYSDEDILRNGRRLRPHFKTDWDPYLILGCNYIGVPALYRTQAIQRADIRNLKSGTIDNLLHAVALRVSAVTAEDKIFHVPSILCHRTKETDWCGEEARKIVSAHLMQQSLSVVEVSPAPLAPQFNRIKFPLPDPPPFVSIIVPTRDRCELIGPCVSGILYNTDYPALELIIVDNGTTEPDALAVLEAVKGNRRVRILRDDRPFNFSQLNNLGASAAKGEILILLNNDTEVLHADWVTELASLASRPDIGAVGAKLLYPDLRVQHAGVIFGPDKAILHQLRFAQRHETGPGGELALLRCTSALTGACLAVRKELYVDVGGLNENRLRVVYNDVDLCRRIAARGLAIVWTPFAELLHRESVSRGLTVALAKVDQQASELLAFWSMNPEFYEHPDPFHNPQIEFQSDCVDFARPPREHRFRIEFSERRPTPFFY